MLLSQRRNACSVSILYFSICITVLVDTSAMQITYRAYMYVYQPNRGTLSSFIGQPNMHKVSYKDSQQMQNLSEVLAHSVYRGCFHEHIAYIVPFGCACKTYTNQKHTLQQTVPYEHTLLY